MKVRITDPGFAGFTGHFGSFLFVDGVSEDISQADAERLACITKIETLKGENPSSAQKLVDLRNKDLEELNRQGIGLSGADRSKEQKPVSEKPKKPKQEKAEKSETTKPAALDFGYVQADLESLADTQGIAGLRSFAEPYAVSGRSIPELIEGLLKLKEAQAAKTPAAE